MYCIQVDLVICRFDDVMTKTIIIVFFKNEARYSTFKKN